MSNCERWKMLRLVDFTLAALGLIVGLPVLLLLMICGFLDTGSPLFFQTRMGLRKKPFVLVKFRTMKLDTISVATHFADVSAITRFGKFLRKTKLDELPQLWNVLRGDMSLVGPRPCLPNQIELIEEREKRKVFDVRPGITGLAQISAIDMSTPKLLAETDELMLKELYFSSYLKYILLTILGKGTGDRIKETVE